MLRHVAVNTTGDARQTLQNDSALSLSVPYCQWASLAGRERAPLQNRKQETSVPSGWRQSAGEAAPKELPKTGNTCSRLNDTMCLKGTSTYEPAGLNLRNC